MFTSQMGTLQIKIAYQYSKKNDSQGNEKTMSRSKSCAGYHPQLKYYN